MPDYGFINNQKLMKNSGLKWPAWVERLWCMNPANGVKTGRILRRCRRPPRSPSLGRLAGGKILQHLVNIVAPDVDQAMGCRLWKHLFPRIEVITDHHNLLAAHDQNQFDGQHAQ